LFVVSAMPLRFQTCLHVPNLRYALHVGPLQRTGKFNIIISFLHGADLT
jgi:hypothetical protein